MKRSAKEGKLQEGCDAGPQCLDRKQAAGVLKTCILGAIDDEQMIFDGEKSQVIRISWGKNCDDDDDDDDDDPFTLAGDLASMHLADLLSSSFC